MNFKLNDFDISIDVYERETRSDENIEFSFMEISNEIIEYKIAVDSVEPISARVEIKLNGEKGIYHVIPCNIHGDNNLSYAKPGYFPNLTDKFPEHLTSSPEWEFRADRASHPVSVITCENGAIGISISPYSDDSDNPDGFIRNGVYSRLPDIAGVSLGYLNYPCTFTNKEDMTPSTFHKTKKAFAQGRIYAYRGNGRRDIYKILKDIYAQYRECPKPLNTYRAYLSAFISAFENINWHEDYKAFTNMKCSVPTDLTLKAWRPLIEIGWTGIGVLVYPLLSAQILLDREDDFTNTLYSCFDQMADKFNESSGLFYDIVQPRNDSLVNGWWAGYMVRDCHCAYTNGSGIYYMLKTYMLLKDNKGIERKKWLEKSLLALDTIISLQKPDGNYGYTYSQSKPEMLDDEGFAGVWFAAACAYAYKITGNVKYLESAKKGISYYYTFVKELSCWGTPMDTWKSIDEEGNLGFIRAARHLHEITNEKVYITMMEDSANYEYLWRYAYKARPELPPLKNSGWNSCGGSVTSVSNPHIHPMGIFITAELLYLYKCTNEEYHYNRAYDGLCWGLATADLYPRISGYGELGVMTERYCPSDGLTIEKFAHNNENSSMWFTFNGWASAAVLEGLTQTLLDGEAKL